MIICQWKGGGKYDDLSGEGNWGRRIRCQGNGRECGKEDQMPRECGKENQMPMGEERGSEARDGRN